MKKNVFKILVFQIFCFFLISSCKNEVKESNSMLKNEILIILKSRTFKKDTTYYSDGHYSFIPENNIFYLKEGDFFMTPLRKNNYKKDDTVKIITNKSILFYHRYYINKESIFNFIPGDTVIIEYPSDYPIVSIKNNRLSDYELNYFTRYSINNQPNEIPVEFNLNAFNSQENKEKENNKKEFYNFYSLKSKKLDSLHRHGLINHSVYKFIKTDNDYLIVLNENKESNLQKEFQLTYPTAQKILLDAFELVSKTHFNEFKKCPDYYSQFLSISSFKEISDKNKDFLLTYYLEKIAIYFSKSEFITAFNIYEKNVTDKNLSKILKLKYKKELKSTAGKYESLKLLDKENNITSFEDLILKTNKGKVIYVDLWASWCLPCRKGIPSSINLREYYKQKNVVFIYMAFNDKLENWKIAINEENLESYQNSYFITNSKNSKLIDELGINSIPRFLLYDKTGKLVNSNAPRPDSKEIKNEINKYLNN